MMRFQGVKWIQISLNGLDDVVMENLYEKLKNAKKKVMEGEIRNGQRF